MNLNQEFIQALNDVGCDIIGFADLHGLRGVNPNVPEWPKYVTCGVIMGVTYAAGDTGQLLEIFTKTAVQFLKDKGYKTNTVVKPLKMLGTLSGLGWVGRCAMFNTEQTGPALRLTCVLTNAPFECGTPVKQSLCPPDCTNCADVCPTNAISRGLWEQGALNHSEYWNYELCLKGRSKEKCGAICISACYYAQK